MYWGDVKDGQELPPIEYFDIFKSKVWSTSTFQEEWPVHYTRSVENQLDMTHLAFTHKKTIGNPNTPVVDGPYFEWLDETTMRFGSVIRKDDGSVARKASELKQEELQGFLEFRFPNTWRLAIGDWFQNMAAFVPVDETTSITYIRLYQKIVTIPVLSHAVSWLLTQFNKRVLAEDRPMVSSQDPIRSDLNMDEMLVPGDSPIIEYRKRRQELLNADKTGSSIKSITGKTNSTFPQKGFSSCEPR